MSLIVPEAVFSLHGTLKMFERDSDKGRVLRCFFCPECGTRIYHEPQGRARLVVTLGIAGGADVSGGRHLTRVERLNLFGVTQDVGELPREKRLFFGGQFQMRERGHPFDIGDGEGRGHSSMVTHPGVSSVRRAAGRR